MSLAECIVIVFVALWAVGPERLPKLAYQCGRWYQRCLSHFETLKRSSNDTIKHLQLTENEKRAEKADEHYQSRH